MELDLILAIAHHLLAFTMAGTIGAEFVLLRPGLTSERLGLIGAIDGLYGTAATLLVAVGFCRVFFGLKGAEAYLTNWVFWTKIGAFIVVALLSILPTLSIMRWRREAKANPAFVIPADGMARARAVLLAEIVIFVFIPGFAAAMARGYGL